MALTISSTAVVYCSGVRETDIDGTCTVGGEKGPVATFGMLVMGSHR